MIANFRISHVFSGSDRKPVDDSLDAVSFRGVQKSYLFGGNAFHVARQDQIIFVHGNADRVMMQVDPWVPFETRMNLLYNVAFGHCSIPLSKQRKARVI